ncbi:hypothetical protein HZB01_01005 [Candidatus Woesearchaeota archaeon]|nr:hypothetical protein [Candidatus Woesearchaeota archaeon]
MEYKNKKIDIETHAFLRALERGSLFGLDYYETRERILITAKDGVWAKKHQSTHHKTYKRYFSDNLTVYVICREKEKKEYVHCVVKTIIIERGRE